MNYISSAELARRCDVSRAAVAIAIRDNRIDPKKVRRAGGRVLVEEDHGFSVLGHHAKRKPRPSPSPERPAAAPTSAADDLASIDLLAWGAAPILPEEPEVLTGTGEVADLEQQIEQWSSLVQELEELLASWDRSYSEFREWIRTKASAAVLARLEEEPAVRHAVCELVDEVLKNLRAGLDEVHIKTTVQSQ